LKNNENVLDVVEEFLAGTDSIYELSVYSWSECATDAEQTYPTLLASYSDTAKVISSRFGEPEYDGAGPSGGGLNRHIETEEIEINSRAEAICFWKLPMGKLIKLEQTIHDARTLIHITLTVSDIETMRSFAKKKAEAKVRYEAWGAKNSRQWWQFWKR
jgi:hypothetical protein